MTEATNVDRTIGTGALAATRACDAPRGRVLTHRRRRLLRKQNQATRLTQNEGQHNWVKRFVAEGTRQYAQVWKIVAEPPSPGVERMLLRAGRRIERTGRIDLRQLDRRFWELLFVCGWWPFAGDPIYWPEERQRCRRRLQAAESANLPHLRQRHGDYAPEVAEAYRTTAVRGTLYDWWCGLDAQTRDMLKEDSRAVYEGKDAFSDRKRKNEKSRSR